MMAHQRPISLSPVQIACKNCRQCHLCLIGGLDAIEMEQLNGIVKHNGILSRGDHVFRQGDKLRSLYVVRSGMVKVYVSTADGTEQTVGFHLPGDVLGLDALGG